MHSQGLKERRKGKADVGKSVALILCFPRLCFFGGMCYYWILLCLLNVCGHASTFQYVYFLFALY